MGPETGNLQGGMMSRVQFMRLRYIVASSLQIAFLWIKIDIRQELLKSRTGERYERIYQPEYSSNRNITLYKRIKY